MTKKKPIRKKSGMILLFSYLGALAAVLFDQFTKYLAVLSLKGKSPCELIPGVFEFRYLENQSAAFSIDPVSILHKICHFKYFDENPESFLNIKMIFFVVMTIIVVSLIVLFYARIPWNRRYLPLNLIALGFLAGAIGNLIDRIKQRYVVDFLYFKLIDFPVFNVADIYVTLSAAGLMIAVLFVYSEEDWNLLFPPKRKGDCA